MIKPDSLDDLRKIYGDVRVMHEAGIDYIFIPELSISTSKGVHTMCALLCPTQHPSGYMTRLFLACPLHHAGQSQNWTEHRILDRAWHTWSWQNVDANQTLAQILVSHMRALR